MYIILEVRNCSFKVSPKSNFLLTSVHIEISKNEEQKRRFLNILYCHICFLWQIDTIFCSVKVILQIVLDTEDDDIEDILNQVTDVDYLFGSFYFCSVSIIRIIKHFFPNVYVEMSNKHNGHWILPINITSVICVKIGKFYSCVTFGNDKYCSFVSNIIFGAILFFIISLHGIVALHILWKKCFKRRNQVIQFQANEPDNLINFSPGSIVLLIMTIYLGLLLMIYLALSIPVTTSSASMIQLVNITSASIYWTISQDDLRHRAERNAKKMCRIQSSFIDVLT